MTHFSFARILGEIVLENSRVGVIIQWEGITGGINLREVVKVFSFPTLPLTNPKLIFDFKREHKAQTYIRARQRAFGCDPIDNEVRW